MGRRCCKPGYVVGSLLPFAVVLVAMVHDLASPLGTDEWGQWGLLLSVVSAAVIALAWYRNVDRRADLADRERRAWALVVLMGGPIGQIVYCVTAFRSLDEAGIRAPAESSEETYDGW